jgi:hypothetical protein
MGYRFRVDDGKLVLQVYVPPRDPFAYGREGAWRDATVEDIPVADPFRSEPIVSFGPNRADLHVFGDRSHQE